MTARVVRPRATDGTAKRSSAGFWETPCRQFVITRPLTAASGKSRTWVVFGRTRTARRWLRQVNLNDVRFSRRRDAASAVDIASRTSPRPDDSVTV